MGGEQCSEESAAWALEQILWNRTERAEDCFGKKTETGCILIFSSPRSRTHRRTPCRGAKERPKPGRDPWGGQSDYPCLLHLRDQLETLQNSPRNLRRRGTCVLQVQVDINLCSL